MSDENFKLTSGIVFGAIMLGVFLGVVVASETERGATEKKIMYCIEQPSACKVKYDYYQLDVYDL